ncbi:hypothetical protein TD95_001196 [Thielaviopsis punctulata]|uniref:Mediator of RNA polymerase II transcription subunit 31 n=1 Tax=Thielaviopsis punctulata TaxID=72032 RepID=A0A0F4ZCU1_9PEZI|nr:hypothetical protein TD95_001196 [Thielaviopsis punctulata]
MTSPQSPRTSADGFFSTSPGSGDTHDHSNPHSHTHGQDFPPPLARSSTAPDVLHSPVPTRSHLSPDDAFFMGPASPPSRMLEPQSAEKVAYLASAAMGATVIDSWLQLDPDNYTDQNTFLESLQRNPRLQPYEFWPLVADCSIIVQHVCTVIIFVTSFVGIFQERVSPLSIVGFSSFVTFVGWLIWERWVADEEDIEEYALLHGGAVPGTSDPASGANVGGADGSAGTGANATNSVTASSGKRVVSTRRRRPTMIKGAAVRSPVTVLPPVASPGLPSDPASASSASFPATTLASPMTPSTSDVCAATAPGTTPAPIPACTQQAVYDIPPVPIEEPRSIRRIATFKSAILIYCTLLGLSPILKSLTRSTSSDSIWAMCFCLLAINVFSFDYSGGVGNKFPASLSTNAAVMASTVLASRLPSTGQVFSLTLFSIEVFGLFPIFRIYARLRGWVCHSVLTLFLVLGAGAGVGLISGDPQDDCYKAIAGALGAALVSAVAMGGCSWWLIGLQKYKNEIYGPWDPARPIIINRRRFGVQFVQSLANPLYLNHLASEKYLQKPEFVAYLDYLQYWSKPPYLKYLTYPGPTLRNLELLQQERFRTDILSPDLVQRMMQEGIAATAEWHKEQ